MRNHQKLIVLKILVVTILLLSSCSPSTPPTQPVSEPLSQAEQKELSDTNNNEDPLPEEIEEKSSPESPQIGLDIDQFFRSLEKSDRDPSEIK